ncbi:MAG: HD domain-containing protein [Kiritimatiellales bacterium]
MIADRLEPMSVRFCSYVDRFRRDGTLHPMQQLKVEHTLRVAADARAIAVSEHWKNDDIALAETVGLFHDIARFPQFEQYRTFSDAESVDHGDLGFQTLENENLLDGLPAEDRALVLHAVRYHNKKELPRVLSAHEEKHLRLIRDADRLDIFFVCWDSFQSGQIHEHPELMMHIDLNGAPTDAVLDQFERGETIDYRNIHSMADRFVLQLSWMHDLSYDSSRRLVCERGILEKFISVLPVKTDRLLDCFEKTEAFLTQA